MNKYLEKVALNAQKARAMAKEVGVIADPRSQWKWALRNLRDDQGNALQGKALADAKGKLGSADNNAWQQIKAKQRKQAPGIELAGNLKNGKVSNKKIYEGGQGYIPNAIADPLISDSKAQFFHTHPASFHPEAGSRYADKIRGGEGLNDPLVIRRRTHRYADMSGAEQAYHAFPMTPAQLKKETKSIKPFLDNQTDTLNRSANLIQKVRQGIPKRRQWVNGEDGTGIITRAIKRMGRIEKGRDNILKKIPNAPSNLFGRAANTAADIDYLRPNRMTNIFAPERDIEAVHKLTNIHIGTEQFKRAPAKVRTVYFDRTPRKMESNGGAMFGTPQNPLINKL